MGFFGKFTHKLSEMFSGADGFWSAMRWITVTTCNTIILVWAAVSIYNWDMQAIPESVVTVFGIAIAGKYVQSINETKENIANINQSPTIK